MNSIPMLGLTARNCDNLIFLVALTADTFNAGL